jgi:hypothetical protein
MSVVPPKVVVNPRASPFTKLNPLGISGAVITALDLARIENTGVVVLVADAESYTERK